MDLFEVLFLAVGLSLDAFAVALGVGSSGNAGRHRDAVRLSFHFGLFQFLMPIAGWYIGSLIEPMIASFDHWIAFGLLAFVAFRMIRSGFAEEQQPWTDNPTRGMTLLLLSFATSVDALAVGLSLAMIRIHVLYPSFIIGLVTFTMTYLGIRGGNRLNARYGQKLGIIGGVVLILVGMQIVFKHL